MRRTRLEPEAHHGQDDVREDARSGAVTLQRIVDMKNAECFPPGAASNDNIPATPGFVSGQVVGWTLPSSIVSLLKGFNRQATYNFFPMPGETAAETRVNASPTDAFAVWSKSSNKAAAYRLIDYMATPAATGRYAALTGAMSPYQAATGKRILFELRGLSGFLDGELEGVPADEPELAEPGSRRDPGQGRPGPPHRAEDRRPDAGGPRRRLGHLGSQPHG